MKPSCRVRWQCEGLGIVALATMLIYFLGISWRKWPDPLVDFGPQCYAIWRLSEGARIYHDFVWNYGPCSLYIDAWIFRLFGTGIMVLVAANLVVYALILTLVYIAFRRAWGPHGAFAGTAVFISVFSFSHLLGVGNYNYATPYSPETVHGMLVILVAAILVWRWCEKSSRGMAFLIGLCGGLSAVLKPEFMLAMGILGIAACVLRIAQGLKPTASEIASIVTGGLIPTAAFTLWFARTESLRDAFIDASQAWWMVLVNHVQSGATQQGTFLGLNNLSTNLRLDAETTGCALLAIGLVYLASWFASRPWHTAARAITALAAILLIWYVPLPGGWMDIGRALPALVFILFVTIVRRLFLEMKKDGKASARTLMSFILVLLGGIMLARMPLFARVYHFGFIQAALAGMVVAAALVTEWGRVKNLNECGRRIASFGGFLLLAVGCVTIAMKSYRIRADQTEPVGMGSDQFYSTTRTIDGNGAVVNWTADRLRSIPQDSVVLVQPDGLMINYLARRRSVEPGWLIGEKEEDFVRKLSRHPPDYVVLITRDLTEFGVAQFGAPGNIGYELVKWVAANYAVDAGFGGDPLAPNPRPGALIMKRKAN